MTAHSRSRVQLLLRTRELGAMRDVLEYVKTLPGSERETWVETNGQELSMAFQQFMSVSERTLKNMDLDTESLKLSFDLVTMLRETETLVAEVFGDTRSLMS